MSRKTTKFTELLLSNLPNKEPENVHVKGLELKNEKVPESENVLVSEKVSNKEPVGESENTIVHVPYAVLGKSSAKKDWKPKVNSFEATHTRKTVWLRDELLELLNNTTVSKGDLTSIINEGLEMVLKKKNKKNQKESENS